MTTDVFALSPVEEQSRSIRGVGDTVVVRDPYRWSRAPVVLPILALGALELFFVGHLHRGRRRGKLILGDGPPLDHPQVLRLAGAVTLLVALSALVWIVRDHVIVSSQGLTRLSRRRFFVPWTEIHCVYRRTDRLPPSRVRFGSKKRLKHTLIMEHGGLGRPIFATTGDPRELDLAVEVIWRYRHEGVGPWPRQAGGTDPMVEDHFWRWVVGLVGLVQFVATYVG